MAIMKPHVIDMSSITSEPHERIKMDKKPKPSELYLSIADVQYLYDELKEPQSQNVSFENLFKTMGLYRHQPDVVAYLYKLFYRVQNVGTMHKTPIELMLTEQEFLGFMDPFMQPMVSLFWRMICVADCWGALFGIIAAILNVISPILFWNKFCMWVFIGNIFWVLGALTVARMAIAPILLNKACDTVILHQLLNKADERPSQDLHWRRMVILPSDKLF